MPYNYMALYMVIYNDLIQRTGQPLTGGYWAGPILIDLTQQMNSELHFWRFSFIVSFPLVIVMMREPFTPLPK